MNPQDSLKKLMHIERELRQAKKSGVKVGLISSKVGGQIYGDGQTVLSIGAIHEYGGGNVPMRSFLRTPFLIKKKEISALIGLQFSRIADGKTTTDKALGLIGVYATNISKGAFTSQGYGTWQDIKESTKLAKGSSKILIDTGTLRNSITWQVE